MTEDKLDRIFTLQKALDIRIFQNDDMVKTVQSYDQYVDTVVSRLCTAIVAEAVELQRLTNWKWWKKPTEFNYEEARKELIDIIHFVVSAAIVLGMTPSDILEEYEKKNKINHERQEQGY